MENKKALNFNGKKLFLEVSEYINNGNLGILAYTEEDLYGDITINLSGFSVDRGEGFINALTKDSGLEKKLIREGIIKEVITTVKYNMGHYDLVEFNLEKLKEYDPKGVKKYQEEFEEDFEEEFEGDL